ncbi:DUF262 domain-containing protein [candidate division KSB1 bacterium]|nr:DUF262 domain-containing protein [candidate division KSB1 bacterium]
MKTQKYSVNQHLIQTILSWVNSNEIAIPEIQRPFVWDSTKVRDLLDSLYRGYPIGYLIAWKNPTVRLKDGKVAEGKKILIDGQQRVTALSAAILGNYVIGKDYRKIRIKIAFHPVNEKFEVFNTAIEKDRAWLPDISQIYSEKVSLINLVNNYCDHNPEINRDLIFTRIEYLKNIVHKQIGLIELDSDLDIEEVTEIFIRINSQGVVLSQADFAMSKIAANEIYHGSVLRKCIDYFCHMAVAPDFYNQIVDFDKEFTATHYFQKLSWLRNENDDLYDPEYTDLLRVAFTSEFERGRLSDLVSLLSGRNFETRTFEEDIALEAFKKLEKGIINFINESNFKRFVMIIKSAGFISPSLIRSQNTLNFAYILYLKLRAQNLHQGEIEKFVRRWFVFSILTGRYSGSPESSFDLDIRTISSKSIHEYLQILENAELSDAFWNVSLVQSLESPVASSPYFNVFLAAQVKANDKGFLSKDITIADLIIHKGDIHHIFPKEYLKKGGLKKGQYNQIANYVYMQSEINIQIGNRSPKDYFDILKSQCDGGVLKFGAITDDKTLRLNLKMNCIPEGTSSFDFEDYEKFLIERRKLMAQKIKSYYFSL